MIDIVGTIGDSSNWGENKTLVRKAAAIVPSTTYSDGDWDSYASDTTTYLGFFSNTEKSRIDQRKAEVTNKEQVRFQVSGFSLYPRAKPLTTNH